MVVEFDLMPLYVCLCYRRIHTLRFRWMTMKELPVRATISNRVIQASGTPRGMWSHLSILRQARFRTQLAEAKE